LVYKFETRHQLLKSSGVKWDVEVTLYVVIPFYRPIQNIRIVTDRVTN